MEVCRTKVFELMSRTVWPGFFVEEDPSWQCQTVRLRKSQELIWSLPGSRIREGRIRPESICLLERLPQPRKDVVWLRNSALGHSR